MQPIQEQQTKTGSRLTSSCTNIKICVSKIPEVGNFVCDCIEKTYWYTGAQAWAQNTTWKKDCAFPLMREELLEV